jgi:hypothetical protein
MLLLWEGVVSQSLSERWASRIAKGPATSWGPILVWGGISIVYLSRRGSEGTLTFTEGALFVLLWVSIVFYTFTIEGLRRLLSAKSREIDELKASRNHA